MASNDEGSATNTNTNDNTNQASSNEAGSSGGGSWWNSFIKSAKEKSINAIEFMKNDLAEFKTTMTTDTSKLVSQASEQLKETTGASSLLDTLSKSINLNLNLNFLNEDTAEKIVVGGERKKSTSDHASTAMNIHERFKQELRQLQSNESTFLTNPASSTFDNDYDDWEACFNSDNYKSAISDLLIENSSLRLLYSQLVPAQISNNQFWSRYFFKVNQLEEDYKKRVKLIQKATTNQIEAVNKEETFDWDDDESTTEVSPNTTNELQTYKGEGQTGSKKSLAAEETTSASTTAIDDDVQQPSGVENNQIEPSTLPNEILKSAASSSSQIDVKSIELNIDGQELANKLTETSVPKSTTEDSDEWEKVSDVALSEVNEKKSTKHVEADVTLTDSVEKLAEANQHQEESSGEEIESDKQEKEPSAEQQSTSTTSESKTKENKKQTENDWEDWDE